MIDAGQVATEMSYYLVGSRELDGGAMVTASHNPKAYTGVKLLREGALALSGDAGIQDVREARSRPACPIRPAAGSVEEIDIYPDFHEHMLGARRHRRDRAAADPRRRQRRHGRADGRARCSSSSISTSTTSRWEPNGDFPEPEPNPLLEENRRMLVEQVKKQGVDLGDRLGRRRRPLLLHRRRAARFCDGDFVCALLARATLAKEPGVDDPLRPALEPRRPRHGRRGRREVRSEPRRPRLLQDPDARDRRGLRRRGLRPLLLPPLLLRGLGDDAGPADARAGLARGPLALRADGGVPLQVLHLRGDQLGGGGPAGEDGGDRGALLRR